jgi:hypothetical protein
MNYYCKQCFYQSNVFAVCDVVWRDKLKTPSLYLRNTTTIHTLYIEHMHMKLRFQHPLRLVQVILHMKYFSDIGFGRWTKLFSFPKIQHTSTHWSWQRWSLQFSIMLRNFGTLPSSFLLITLVQSVINSLVPLPQKYNLGLYCLY